MSTNKTQNYDLHAWEPEDDFLRSEAIQTLTNTKAEIVIGTYTGGVYTDSEKQERVIDLGFAPKALLIVRNDGCMGADYHVAGGLLFQSSTICAAGNSAMIVARLEGRRLTLYNINYAGMNQSNKEYRYLALK